MPYPHPYPYPHHHHGPALHAKLEPKKMCCLDHIYAKPRQDTSSESGGDSYDSSSECHCVKCQPVIIHGRAVHRESYLDRGKPRPVQRNYIQQQNTNLPPNTRCGREFELKGAILIPNAIPDKNRVCQKQHQHEGRDQLRHTDDDRLRYERYRHEEEMYNLRKALKKERKKVEEMQEQQLSDRQKQLDKINNRKPKREHALPVLHRDWSPPSAPEERSTFDMAADVIRQKLERCDIDLKRSREKTAQEAQSEARRQLKAKLEQKEADRREALEHDRAVNGEAMKERKKEPKAILVMRFEPKGGVWL